MKLDEVKRVTGLSRSTIYIRMDVGSFPKSVKLGKTGEKHCAMGWRAGDIIDWLKALSTEVE